MHLLSFQVQRGVIRGFMMSHLPALNCVSLPHNLHLPSNHLLSLIAWQWMVVSLFVHDHELKHNKCTVLAAVLEGLKPDTLACLLSHVDHLGVCVSQPDEHFIAMAVARKGTFTSHDGSTVATLDHYALVFLNGESIAQTTSCELLVHGVKCDSCKTYRATLRTRCNCWRWQRFEQISDTTSHANER